MSEWGVVGVIIALVGLMVSIIKPIVSLTKSITSLDGSVQTLQKAIDQNAKDNADDHDELWQKEDEQDKKINSHETRISLLENK